MKKFIHTLKKKADKDDPKSLNELAFEYYAGKNIKKNNKLAVKLWLKSAKQKYPMAYYNLGYMYYNGFGVTKNIKKAIYYHELSCKIEHKYQTTSLFWLAYNIYLNKISGKPNIKKGLKYLEESAKRNLVNAQWFLALFYKDGKVSYQDQQDPKKKVHEYKIKVNKAKTIKYLEMASINNFIPATSLLASCYINGFGVKKDYTTAYVLLDSIKFSNNSKMISSMTLTQEDKKHLKKTIINQKKRVLYLLNKLKKK